MSTLKDWVRAQVQVPSQKQDINALSAAFRLAIMGLLSSRMSAEVLEETMTGTVLGALATSAKICSDAYSDSSSPGCSWVKYSKAGQTWSSESKSGADFAILIDMGGSEFRLAVFQAKRNASGSSSVSIEQRRKGSKTDSGIQQFARLVKYANFIHCSNGGEGFCLDNANWVHYLIYEPELIYCCSVDQLEALGGGCYSSFALKVVAESSETALVATASGDGYPGKGGDGNGNGDGANAAQADSSVEDGPAVEKWSGKIDLKEVKLRSFLEVLESGANGLGPGDGWLRITNVNLLNSIINQLVHLMPVCFAGDDSFPRPIMEARKRFEFAAPIEFSVVSSSVFDNDGGYKRPIKGAKASVHRSRTPARGDGLQSKIDQRRGAGGKVESGLSGEGPGIKKRRN